MKITGPPPLHRRLLHHRVGTGPRCVKVLGKLQQIRAVYEPPQRFNCRSCLYSNQ